MYPHDSRNVPKKSYKNGVQVYLKMYMLLPQHVVQQVQNESAEEVINSRARSIRSSASISSIASFMEHACHAQFTTIERGKIWCLA